MAVRRGQEQRSFDDAVAAMLWSRRVEAARASKELSETYVAWGEYGRVLADYLERFDRDRLLVTYTETLEHDPAGALRAIDEFLGVPVVLPDGLGERYHVGGSQRRFPNLQRRLRRSPVGWVWRKLPQGTRSRVFIKVDHWNVKPEATDDEAAQGAERWTAVTEARLREHYADDERRLAETHGVALPWTDA